MSRRIERLNDLIQEEISELIRRQTKDPRLDCFLTVTRVDTSPDLRHAKIYISIMGSDEEKKEAAARWRAWNKIVEICHG